MKNPPIVPLKYLVLDEVNPEPIVCLGRRSVCLGSSQVYLGRSIVCLGKLRRTPRSFLSTASISWSSTR